jgi:hypothetical protein
MPALRVAGGYITHPVRHGTDDGTDKTALLANVYRQWDGCTDVFGGIVGAKSDR